MRAQDEDRVRTAEQLADRIGTIWRLSTLAARTAGGLPTLPPAQAEALHRIVRAEESTPTRIAEELRLSRPMVSELVRKLEDNELIVRRRSIVDGRSVVLTATDRGRYVHEYFSRGVVDVFTEALTGLSDRDARRLGADLEVLERLSARVESIAASAESAAADPGSRSA